MREARGAKTDLYGRRSFALSSAGSRGSVCAPPARHSAAAAAVGADDGGGDEWRPVMTNDELTIPSSRRRRRRRYRRRPATLYTNTTSSCAPNPEPKRAPARAHTSAGTVISGSMCIRSVYRHCTMRINSISCSSRLPCRKRYRNLPASFPETNLTSDAGMFRHSRLIFFGSLLEYSQK